MSAKTTNDLRKGDYGFAPDETIARHLLFVATKVYSNDIRAPVLDGKFFWPWWSQVGLCSCWPLQPKGDNCFSLK